MQEGPRGAQVLWWQLACLPSGRLKAEVGL